MTIEQFTYWLQGFAELNQDPPNIEQWSLIKDRLRLVADTPFNPNSQYVDLISNASVPRSPDAPVVFL